MAKNVMNQLIGKGKVQRAMLGAGIQPVTSDLAASLGLKEARGVVISSLTSGGPAEKAGLKTGDVILKLNGKEVNDSNVLRNEIASQSPGTEVTLTLQRNGNQQDVRVRLGELTPQTARAQEDQGGGAGNGERGKLGLTLAPLTPDLAAQVGVPRDLKGVVVESVD